MNSLAKLKTKMDQAKSNGPRAPEEADLPNAVRHRRSLPASLDMIVVEDRLRAVDEAAVTHIAESMHQQGQLYPIQLRTIEPGRFRLVAGAHRAAAARMLGWTHIEAFLVDDLEEEEAALLEIDENLYRVELDAFDRGRFLCKRKQIYQRLYPETKPGGDRKSLEYLDNIKRQNSSFDSATPENFVDATASSTPFSTTTIKRAVRIGENIIPELQDAIADTPIRKREGDLYRIADMDPEEQRRLLDRLNEAEQPPKNLAALQKDPAATPSPPPTNVERLKKVWIRCSELERSEFRDWLDLQGGE